MVRRRRGVLIGSALLMAAGRLAGLVVPASSKFLIDDVISKGRYEIVIPLVAAGLLATGVQALAGYWSQLIISRFGHELIADLRRRVQAHVLRLPIRYYDASKTGTLVARVMSDVEGLRHLVGPGLLDLAGGLLTAGVAVAFLVHLSPLLTLVTITTMLGFAAVVRQAARRLQPLHLARSRTQADVLGRLTETFAGIRVVKGHHAESREAQTFAAGVDQIFACLMHVVAGTARLSAMTTLLMGIMGPLIMLIGVHEIRAGVLTVGGFVTFTVFLAFLVSPMAQIVGVLSQLAEARAGLDRVREILGEAPEDCDPRRSVALHRLRGDVRFEHVSFAYLEGRRVLQDLTLHCPPGATTALVGPSGAGKSTIIGLVAAFHSPDSGRVLVDGTDLASVRLDSYRTQMGLVLQDTFLFDGPLRDNITFARPDASEARIREVCRVARVDEFVARMPDGYDTMVGEHGTRLSGGQRQRVALARALLADPRILILDEATSNLDSESEALIREAMVDVLRNRTTFVIAHRLSTIRRADQILFVEGGRIAEAGTHAALLAQRGRYWDLYTRQHELTQNLLLAPDSREPEALVPAGSSYREESSREPA